jgi:hypothetical protein
VLDGVTESVPSPFDVALEVTGLLRQAGCELRHDAPGEVLELAGPWIAGGEDRWTKSLEMAMTIEGEWPDMVGSDDLAGCIQDDDDPEIGQLVLASAGDGRDAVANLLERPGSDRSGESCSKGRRPEQRQRSITERFEVDRDPSAVERREQIRAILAGRSRRGDHERQPMTSQGLDKGRELRVEDTPTNEAGESGCIGGGRDVHRRLRAGS